MPAPYTLTFYQINHKKPAPRPLYLHVLPRPAPYTSMTDIFIVNIWSDLPHPPLIPLGQGFLMVGFGLDLPPSPLIPPCRRPLCLHEMEDCRPLYLHGILPFCWRFF
jgi:hypothetical protein